MGNPDLRPEVRRGSKGVTGKDRKELQKQTESELQKKESRATVYVFESEEDTKTREIAEKYGITVTKAEFLKHLFRKIRGSR